MRLKPSLYEADAFWQLQPETRKKFTGLHEHHHGWFHESGRWQESVITKEFMPVDAMLIMEVGVHMLKDGKRPVMWMDIAKQDEKFLCTIAMAKTTLHTKAPSPRCAALTVLKQVEEHLGKSEPSTRGQTIAESDSPRTLKG